MKRIPIGLASALLILPVAASAQEFHPSATVPASHHACLAEERRALEAGEGFGMALVADRHGFPGPKHILELAGELELSPQQQEQTRRLFDRMRAGALAVGQELSRQEAELEAAFASGKVNPGALERQVEAGAAVRARLRWVHLAAHLEAYQLLTAEQRARYLALRHGPLPPGH